jgi:adenylate cyclase class IV
VDGLEEEGRESIDKLKRERLLKQAETDEFLLAGCRRLSSNKLELRVRQGWRGQE